MKFSHNVFVNKLYISTAHCTTNKILGWFNAKFL